MPGIKALVTDLDGTLLNSNNRVGELDMETIKFLHGKGIKIIIATGRSVFSFKKVINNDFPVDYLIFDAGAGIMDVKSSNLLFSSFMERNQVVDIAKRLIELKIDFQIRNKIPDSHMYYYKKFGLYNPDFDRINEIYQDYIQELTNIDCLNQSSRIICIAPNNQIVEIIENEFQEFSIIRATSPVDNQSVWMEIYPKGINKGSALTFLCNKIRINVSEIIGFGNDYNDIHFLNILEQSYMVSNAPNDLKLKYNVTVSNDENPISFVMNESLIRENAF